MDLDRLYTYSCCSSRRGTNCFTLEPRFLFCVALEPYLFYVVITTKTVELADPASIAYGLDAGLMFLFLAGLGYLVVKQGRSRREDNRLHPVVLNRFRRFMKLQAIVGGIYIASALPIFWIDTPIGPPRFLLWSCPFIILTAFRKPKSNPDAK